MTPDISRDTFDPLKRFSRVVMQQGRVQLDSDWNEQAEILIHTIRQMFVDLVGPYAAPPAPDPDPDNFQIGLLPIPPSGATDTTIKDLSVSKGQYYVAGILCDSTNFKDDEMTYSKQRFVDVSNDLAQLAQKFPFLVYLDVWEEPVTALDDPELREEALGGPDTTARTQVRWAIRAEAVDGALDRGGTITPPPSGSHPGTPSTKTFKDKPDPSKEFASLPNDSPAWSPESGDSSQRWGWLRARVSSPGGSDASDPCAIAPSAQFRGTENQLYRVEIHSEGELVFDSANAKVNTPTFKWSRDNGMVAFIITKVDGSDTPWTVYLQDFGRDSRFSLDVGDWVEIIDREARPVDGAAASDLLRVTAVDPIDRSVILERPLVNGATGVPPVIAYDKTAIATKKPILRRWDQRRGAVDSRDDSGTPLGAIPIDRQRLTMNDLKTSKPVWQDPDDGQTWYELEDGVQVQFQRPLPDTSSVAHFRPGDYWLIPARTASNGIILWPKDDADPHQPAAQPPKGPQHHYAPLAVVIDPESDPGKPEDWVIDRRTHINRNNIVIGPQS